LADPFPTSGQASTYSNFFVGKTTASGDIYTHEGFTAALLPRQRWNALPMGTLLKVTANGRSVIVKVNDKGAGNNTMSRVLDLSRAAYAYLINKPLTSVTDQSAGTIQLTAIIRAPSGSTPGPAK
jgi:rare lipoprotein A